MQDLAYHVKIQPFVSPLVESTAWVRLLRSCPDERGAYPLVFQVYLNVSKHRQV